MDSTTKGGLFDVRIRVARHVVRRKVRAHTVAELPICDTRPYRHDLACAVGARYEVVADTSRVLPVRNDDVAELTVLSRYN